MNRWRFLPYDRFSAFENMATDEAIVRAMQQIHGPPLLRLYSWEKPSISVGFAQNIHDSVNLSYCEKQGIPIVRRPTGGKAVLHERELAYALIARNDDPLFPSGIMETYKMISKCIIAFLHALNIDAVMEQNGRSSKVSLDKFCFSMPSRYEILVDGRKICGSAQMRTKKAFLQHGSLLIGFDAYKTYMTMRNNGNNLEREVKKLSQAVISMNDLCHFIPSTEILCAKLAESFRDNLDAMLETGALTYRERSIKEHLLRNKYMTSNWNMEGKTKIQ